MATTNIYNHTTNLFASGQCPASATFKAMLLNNTATFTASHTAVTSVSNAGANEVYGSGWTQGGETLTGVAFSISDTNGSMFTANDPQVTLSGGNLTFYKYLILTGTLPLFFVTLTSPLTVTDGNVCGIDISANGIVKFLPAA